MKSVKLVLVAIVIILIAYAVFRFYCNLYDYNRIRSVEWNQIDTEVKGLIEENYGISVYDGLNIEKFSYTGGRDGQYVLAVKNVGDLRFFLENVFTEPLSNECVDDIVSGFNSALSYPEGSRGFSTVDNKKVMGFTGDTYTYPIPCGINIYKENNSINVELTLDRVSSKGAVSSGRIGDLFWNKGN